MMSTHVKRLSSSLSGPVALVFAAKLVRTFCYGFLGITLPLYLTDLGMRATAVGTSITLTLVGSAGLTWLVRRPAERFGPRVALAALAALSVVAGVLLLVARNPWVVVIAAMLGNVAVGTGETGPFLTVEQVVIARAVAASSRTRVLSAYNLVGYASAALGAATVALGPATIVLFGAFLAAAALQAVAYARLRLPAPSGPARRSRGPLPSAPLIRRLAALFALDAFAGGFVLQSLVAYFLHERFGLALETLGVVFALAQVLTAASLLLAPACARRFGLLATMVVSHLASNVFLIGLAIAPIAWVAVALLLGRHALSQMDVPTRQAYVMAVVADREREAAASVTTVSRTAAQAIAPAITGWVMHALALSAPFALGGVLKIVYDLALWWTFRDVRLRE